MGVLSVVLVLVAACGVADSAHPMQPASHRLVFRGAADASSAVAVGAGALIVADDENNILRAYRIDRGGMPVFTLDLTPFLDTDPEHPEADIEGATRVGNRIYWITSHGRNKDGKMRLSRYRFFATDITGEGRSVTIRPVGKPYRRLLNELLRIPDAARLGFFRATRLDEDLKKKEREKLAPKQDGLNIEALCASADGGTIYIGFRNPGVRARAKAERNAIVVPLHNAPGVVERGQAPVFGEPMPWNLEGLAIRSMEYSAFHRTYFIIAGRPDEQNDFALYRWTGDRDMSPELVRELRALADDFTPEALVPFSDGRLLLLSDDGSLEVKVSGPGDCLAGEYNKNGTCLNKFLADPAKKTFRGIWLELPSH